MSTNKYPGLWQALFIGPWMGAFLGGLASMMVFEFRPLEDNGICAAVGAATGLTISVCTFFGIRHFGNKLREGIRGDFYQAVGAWAALGVLSGAVIGVLIGRAIGIQSGVEDIASIGFACVGVSIIACSLLAAFVSAMIGASFPKVIQPGLKIGFVLSVLIAAINVIMAFT